ncbi:MAG: ABC transporter permease [Halobacteriaceae archaeon]
MSAVTRVGAEAGTAWRSFLRRRTAVFFTFLFPLILVAIFGAVVQTNPTGGGLFARPTGYYVPGYLAIIVLFTPLSRVGSSIARYRDGNRFEKLATTPLRRVEWLAAHTLVNTVIILLAAAVVLAVIVAGLGATVTLSWVLVPFVVLAVVVFCGLGALIGRVAESQDGVVAASNAIALPLVFLSETFVSPDLLPAWVRPALNLSPLTYFARGVRAATYTHQSPWADLLVLAGLAVVFFALGAYALPRGE